MVTAFTVSPDWSIIARDQNLLINGGADAQYELECLKTPSFFSSLKPQTHFTRDDIPEQEWPTLEALLTAMVIIPVTKKSRRSLAITVIGDSSLDEIQTTTARDEADLIIIVRTTSTYSELLTSIGYETMTIPHLFVDLAYHHTLSIGPLVYVGETACIACLAGRISRHWGDTPPPPQPTMANNDIKPLIIELIKLELAGIESGDTYLTNRTLSWNLSDRSTRKDQILKVPLCAMCNPRPNTTGYIALPKQKDIHS